MDSGGVGEGVAANDRFIGLNVDTSNFAEQLAGGIELFTDDSSFVGVLIRAYFQRHHDFFESSVAGAFADTVDGALYLAGAVGNGGQGVGYGYSQIIVAVSRNYCFFY